MPNKPSIHVLKRTRTFHTTGQDIMNNTVLRKLHDDKTRYASSYVLAMFHYSHILKDARHLGGYIFQQTKTMFATQPKHHLNKYIEHVSWRLDINVTSRLIYKMFHYSYVKKAVPLLKKIVRDCGVQQCTCSSNKHSYITALRICTS